MATGGENLVEVYSTGKEAKLLASIPTGALPHGRWTSDDNSRVYIGLENGDGVQAIDTATNKVVATIGGGQAPQALVYLSNVANSADDRSNLVPRVNQDSHNILLAPVSGNSTGFIVFAPWV